MIKIMESDSNQLKQNIITKCFLSDGITLNGAELIPINLGPRIAQEAVSINELGKQLLKAAGEGNIEEIKSLMTKGAPFTADWLGTSPLHLAAQNNHLEVCEVLLRAGISRDARTKVDRTPLHMAAYEGNAEIVECLLKHGADCDCRDMLNMSPLHWAAQNGHAEISSILIRYGANTNLLNKFHLTPLDLAAQMNRPDIVEIINLAIRDPIIATQHLQLEMTGDSNDAIDPTVDLTENDIDNPVPIETILMEEADSENSADPERLHINQSESNSVPESSEDVQDDDKYSESMRYLQEHGITMLPADDNNILSSVMENGHSVVLTEAGKQILNSIKPVATAVVPKNGQKQQPSRENNLTTLNMKKIITVTPEEFLAMTANCNVSSHILKQANSKLVTTPKTYVKRIVMKKNKTVPVSATVNISKQQKVDSLTDVEIMRRKLAEANKLIEEYKIRLKKKEAETERYKQQLRLILETQIDIS